MSIPYKVSEKGKPGQKGGGKKKYYATVVSNGTTSMSELIEKIQRKNGIYAGDVIRIVYALHDAIAEEIEDGNIVHLEPLGSFYPTISSEGEESPKEVKSTSIKKVSINYRPSRELRDRMAKVDCKKVKS